MAVTIPGCQTDPRAPGGFEVQHCVVSVEDDAEIEVGHRAAGRGRRERGEALA